MVEDKLSKHVGLGLTPSTTMGRGSLQRARCQTVVPWGQIWRETDLYIFISTIMTEALWVHIAIKPVFVTRKHSLGIFPVPCFHC